MRFFGEKPFLWHFAAITVHLLFSSLFECTVALVSLGGLVASLILSLCGKSSSVSFCRSFIINLADSSSNALWSCFSSDSQFKRSRTLSPLFRLYWWELTTLMFVAVTVLLSNGKGKGRLGSIFMCMFLHFFCRLCFSFSEAVVVGR